MHYSLSFADPAGHLLEIVLTIDDPRAVEWLRLPTWIPGSYLIREFARHVVSVVATQADARRPLRKVDKASWQIECLSNLPLVVRYRVYAWDRSVRGCYFDASRGFVNPAAALLERLDSTASMLTLEVEPPRFAQGRTWRCATTLTPVEVDARSFGRYQAASYDELIDHPIECAELDEFQFEAGGVPHRFVISGRHRGDLERLARDTARVCQAHCDLFGDPRAPFQQYLFQLHVVDDGYGGLEHRSSCALIAPRNDLPVAGEDGVSEGYLSLLGLISHEYFHAWLVKRIKPAAFMRYDLTREHYTQLLWLFEGFTSYYDELMLARSGLIAEEDYLRLVGRHLTQLLRTPGRRVQSLAEGSFDAWIKYYRADENAPNSQVSYYLRGGLVALALDLTLRAAGRGSLDDLMRGLWREYCKTGLGVPEDIGPVFSQLAGTDLTEFFARYIDGTEDPDWAALLLPFGVTLKLRASAGQADRGGRDDPESGRLNLRQLGIALQEGNGPLPTIRHVLSGSAAHAAGLSAGDTLVAVDGLRATAATLGKHLARVSLPCDIPVVYFRHDVLQTTVLSLGRAPLDTAWLLRSAQAELPAPWMN
ncbi:MAG: M61 family metallopeptidase [Casimicrobiaceae bacterium]